MDKTNSIKKKNARILWNKTGDNVITDLIVEEFLLDPTTLKYNNQHFYDAYSCDIGNCIHDWDEQPVSYIIFRMFYNYTYATPEVKLKAIQELLKIEEVYQELTWVDHCLDVLPYVDERSNE